MSPRMCLRSFACSGGFSAISRILSACFATCRLQRKSALRGQVHPYVLNFLKILCERGALHEFEGCVSAFTALYNQAHGIVEASVTTGVPLEAGQRTRLIDKLSAMTGKRIVLSEKVDPGVMGGVLLEMNGKRYDNTLRHRLEAIHAALTAEA